MTKHQPVLEQPQQRYITDMVQGSVAGASTRLSGSPEQRTSRLRCLQSNFASENPAIY